MLLLSCSVMSDSVTSWTVARQAPLSMAFSRQEYWSGLPCFPPRDLPDPGVEPTSLVSCISRWVLYHYNPPANAGDAEGSFHSWVG